MADGRHSDGEPSDGQPGDDALRLAADYWTLRIIGVLAESGDAPQRFTAIARSLGTVSPVTLSNRLRHLHRAGVLHRTEGTAGAASVAYGLTARGQLLVPVLSAIRAFGDAG